MPYSKDETMERVKQFFLQSRKIRHPHIRPLLRHIEIIFSIQSKWCWRLSAHNAKQSVEVVRSMFWKSSISLRGLLIVLICPLAISVPGIGQELRCLNISRRPLKNCRPSYQKKSSILHLLERNEDLANCGISSCKFWKKNCNFLSFLQTVCCSPHSTKIF